MAKGIKIHQEEINSLCSNIDTLIESYNTSITNMNKNASLVNDSWQSNAALNLIKNFADQEKAMKKAQKALKDKKADIIRTTNEIITIDRDIRSALTEYIV